MMEVVLPSKPWGLKWSSWASGILSLNQAVIHFHTHSLMKSAGPSVSPVSERVLTKVPQGKWQCVTTAVHCRKSSCLSPSCCNSLNGKTKHTVIELTDWLTDGITDEKRECVCENPPVSGCLNNCFSPMLLDLEKHSNITLSVFLFFTKCLIPTQGVVVVITTSL